jgi:GntR family transcriptional regulator/MocR family aminotransferase
MVDLLLGLLEVSSRSDQSLTGQLTVRLRQLIADGRLSPGQSLPSSRTLARSLDVSRNTVSYAIEQLAAEGYLRTSQGRRPIVAAGLSPASARPPSKTRKQDASLPRLSPWARDLHRAHWPPIYEGRPRALQPGLADEREFPHDVWGRCLRRAAGKAPRRTDQSHNHPVLQVTLLRHLAEHRGIKARPDQIVIVPTAQSGLALIARVMLGAGDLAWIESPGYGGALAALQAAGAAVVGVPVDTAGMKIAGRRDAPRLIFVTPSHQYPTGHLMPVGRRLELLRLAERVGASIVEDDYDGEFHYEARPIAALQGLSPFRNIFYLGTFSKSMLADIRVGYIVVPEALITTFQLAQRHMGLSATVTIQAALAEFIGAGAYLAHVRKMTRLYRIRRDRLVQALAAEARKRLTVDVPAGGMQLLARCSATIDDCALSSRLARAGVVTRPVSTMTFHRTRTSGLFLGFAAWDDAEIDAAAHTIGRNVR